MSTPQLVPVADLGEAIGDQKVLAFSIGPENEAIILAAALGDAAVALGIYSHGNWAIFPDARARHPYDASALTVDRKGLTAGS